MIIKAVGLMVWIELECFLEVHVQLVQMFNRKPVAACLIEVHLLTEHIALPTILLTSNHLRRQLKWVKTRWNRVFAITSQRCLPVTYTKSKPALVLWHRRINICSSTSPSYGYLATTLSSSASNFISRKTFSPPFPLLYTNRLICCS